MAQARTSRETAHCALDGLFFARQGIYAFVFSSPLTRVLGGRVLRTCGPDGRLSVKWGLQVLQGRLEVVLVGNISCGFSYVGARGANVQVCALLYFQ